jgi:para-nitrobenzyl esterase
MSAPTITVGDSRVRGRSTQGVAAYLGIPYAHDPVGVGRFAAPRPIQGLGGRDHDGSSPSPAVPQPPSRMAALMGDPGGATAEAGSLTLNVWAPVGGTRRPVLFWLHGGALLSGSASWPWYDGGALAAREDIVVVTANYRLGALGYLDVSGLAGGEAPGSCNVGLLDQMCALEWVADNIEAFGGDPAALTLGGHSSGAEAAALIAGTERCGGLARRLLLQSGGANGWVQPADAAAAVTGEYLELLGTRLGATPTTLDQLRAAPLSDVLAAQVELTAGRARRGELLPPFNVIGVGDVPTAGSVRSLADRSDLAVLAGWTRDELVGLSRLAPGAGVLSREDAVARLGPQLDERAEAVLTHYEAGRPELSTADRVAVITGDAAMMRPVLALADTRAATGANTYAYRFEWAGSEFGACHCVDLPFTFDTLDAWPDAPMLGRATPDDVRPATTQLMTAIGSFVRDGRPRTEEGEPWPTWAPERSVARIGGTRLTFQSDLGQRERALLG